MHMCDIFTYCYGYTFQHFCGWIFKCSIFETCDVNDAFGTFVEHNLSLNILSPLTTDTPFLGTIYCSIN